MPKTAERPLPTTAPHQVWFIDVRYLTKIEGHWLYSILLFDGYSRAIVGAGCFDRQHLSRVVQVCRQAMAQWGAPDAMVSDNAGVFLALSPCLQQLGIRWVPIDGGIPGRIWPKGALPFSAACWMPMWWGARIVQDYQFWGHWVHKRTDAQGRIYYLAPEVILGNARGRVVEPSRLRRVFRLRQLTRQVRPQGQIRLHNFGLYVDHGLSGQTVEVLIYDEAMRIEQAEHLLVAYPCVYDTRQRRITAVDGTGRQQYHQAPMLQLMLWTLKLARTVWPMPRYRQGPWLSRPLSAPQMGLFD